MLVRIERAKRPAAEIVLHDTTTTRLSKNVRYIPASLRQNYDRAQHEYWVMTAELVNYLEGRVTGSCYIHTTD